MMKVFFFRSYLLDGDSRSQKIISDYRTRGFDVIPVVWTRGKSVVNDGKSVFFHGKGLVSGRFKNLFHFLNWHIFVIKLLVKSRDKDFLVHCVDLDTAIPCVLTSKLIGKKVVYDGFDHFASSRDLTGLLFNIFSTVEKRLCEASDICILPDASRIPQYGMGGAVNGASNVSIISNIPTGLPENLDHEVVQPVRASAASNDCLHICYVGTLERKHRALEYIPEVCRLLPGRVRFHVAGNGELEGFFRENAMRYQNLSFYGYVPYSRGLKLMQSADVLYGPYLLTSHNHQFAAPNKMYEHMMLGRPLITNSGTPVSKFVEENGTGYIFDGGFEDLVAVLAGVTRETAQVLGDRAQSLWESRYKQLRSEQIEAFFARVDKLVASSDALGSSCR